MKTTTYNRMAAMLIISVFAVPMLASAFAEASNGADEFVSYYDQLDANGKAIYDAINSATPDMTTITVELPFVLTARAGNSADAESYVKTMVKSSIDTAFAALRLSSPLAFWVWGPSLVRWSLDEQLVNNTATISGITFTLSFSNYPKDPVTGQFQGIQKMLDDINAAMDEFHTSSTTERGILLDINNYLVNLVTYDPNWRGANESIFTHDVYGVFVDPSHYAVCDGYSKAFLLLCEKEGFDCVVVMGTALPNLENHAWNYVKMDDGNWYGIDVTWNDDGHGDNPYFLSGGDTFFSTHQQGVFLRAGLMTYQLNSPALNSVGYGGGHQTNYELYSWILAAVIIAAMSIALYKLARKGS
ncbi:MAG: hypothetical protein FWF07_03760 [Methanomassiliicoccaceae archaeon]|nr:hypothetical protein [Methanomassiliicoccaceae archaeon]